jgi:Fe2+ transport system protein FeoA|tara:strand:+ start:353 stop:580 length:228 start_codon:yes stop_codon:yes gene_type:complete
MGILSKVIKHIVASKTLEDPIETPIEEAKKEEEKSFHGSLFFSGRRERIDQLNNHAEKLDNKLRNMGIEPRPSIE